MATIYSSTGYEPADVLASTLTDLLPKYTEMFTTASPVLDQMVNKPGMGFEDLGPTETRKVFNVVTKGIGVATALSAGGLDPIQYSSAQVGDQGEEDLPTNFWAFTVPGTMLDAVAATQDRGGQLKQIQSIVRDYARIAVLQAQEEVVRQILTGVPDGNAINMTTFNGQKTYSIRGRSKTGVFEFAAPASQTSTVHGLPSTGAAGGIPGWHNQNAAITGGWSAQGVKKTREAVALAYNEGAGGGSSRVSVGFADMATYYNIIDGQVSSVRYVSQEMFDKGPVNAGGGGYDEPILFDKIKVWGDMKLDISKFTGGSTGPAGGILYLLDPKSWVFFRGASASQLGYDGAPTRGGPSPIWDPIKARRHPSQYAYVFEMVSKMNFLCRNRRANAVVTGGATL